MMSCISGKTCQTVGGKRSGASAQKLYPMIPFNKMIPSLSSVCFLFLSFVGLPHDPSHCDKHTYTRTHTHWQADVSHSTLTDTCPVPNCRFMKSAGCGCQAVSKRKPSSCYDSRLWPCRNCRNDTVSPCSSGMHICASTRPKKKKHCQGAHTHTHAHKNLKPHRGLLSETMTNSNKNSTFCIICCINNCYCICQCWS